MAGRIRLLVAAVLVSLFISHGQVGAQDKAALPVKLRKTTHIYKTVGDVKIAADVYRSAGTEPRPVVVWLHGGALIVGSRTQIPKNVFELCNQEGWIFISFDYRLAPEVKLPEIAADLKDAFRWLHEEGPALFQADTNRIVVTGGSAGGYLTMLAGAIVTPKPKGLVAYWGYGDIDGQWTRALSLHHGAAVDLGEALAGVGKSVFTNTDDAMAAKARINFYRHQRQVGGWGFAVTGIDPLKESGKLDAYCPVKLVTRAYPPTLLIHGTADTDVPYSCSVDMDRELTRNGVKHELISIQGAEHGLRDGKPEAVAAAHARTLSFIRELMQP